MNADNALVSKFLETCQEALGEEGDGKQTAEMASKDSQSASRSTHVVWRMSQDAALGRELATGDSAAPRGSLLLEERRLAWDLADGHQVAHCAACGKKLLGLGVKSTKQLGRGRDRLKIEVPNDKP